MARTLAGFLLLSIGLSSAAELKPEAVAAWNDYVKVAEANLEATVEAGSPFVRLDEKKWARLKSGAVTAEPGIQNGARAVPGGLIHDWIGTSFIRNATIDQVMSVTRDYTHYKDIFSPAVLDSQTIWKTPERDQYSVTWGTRVMFVNTGIDAECQTHHVRLDGQRVYETSESKKIQEIQDYGRPTERRLEPGVGSGFIWRLFTITRYEARDGGVIVEVEAMALTRDVPASVRFVVNPIVKKLSRNTLLISLRQAREAVLARSAEMTAGSQMQSTRSKMTIMTQANESYR